MTIVASVRPQEAVAPLLARGAILDQRLWHLPTPLAGSRDVRDARARLHAGGVSITSLETDLAGLDDALARGSALRVRAVVVNGGALDGEDPEAAADRLVRALHGPLVGGAPLAIRNGLGEDAAVGFVATEWLLSELPRLRLWFDPSAALARLRAGVGTEISGWIDAYGLRMGGLFVHGLGSDGRGGAHPTDDGAEWPSLWDALPTAAPRVLAMDPRFGDDDVRDALGYLRGL